MKIVMVPQDDIDRLEKARLRLYEMLKDTGYEYELPFGISDVLWEVTHKKYPEVEENFSGPAMG